MKKFGKWERDVFEENIYDKEIRERLLEEDALSSEEDGFMRGYEEGFIESEI